MKKVAVVFLVVSFYLVSSLSGTTTTWTGNVSNDWHESGNWDNGVPDQTMDAVIPNSSSYARAPVVSSGDAPCNSLSNHGSLSVENNYSLNVQNNFTCGSTGSLELFNGNANVGGTLENNGNVTVSDGTAAGTSTLSCGTYQANDAAQTDVNHNGEISCTQFNGASNSTTNLNSGNLSCTHLNDNGSIAENGGGIACDDFALGSGAEFNQSGGSFVSTGGGTFQSGSTVNLSGNASFRYDFDIYGNGILTMDDNANLYANSSTPIYTGGSDSQIDVNGGYFSIQSFSTTGTLNVNGGNAYLEATTNNGTFNVQNGTLNVYDTFTNNGTFSQTGGVANFEGGCTFSSGSTNQQSAGTLKIGGNTEFSSSIINTGSNGELIFDGGNSGYVTQYITNSTPFPNTNMVPKITVNNKTSVIFDGKTSFVANAVEVDDATLDLGSGRLECPTPSTGVFTVGPDGIVKIGGTNSFPNYATKNLDPTSTIIYDSSIDGQSVTGMNYQTVEISGGNKSLAGTARIDVSFFVKSIMNIGNNNLTLSDGASLTTESDSYVATNGTGYLTLENISSGFFPIGPDLTNFNGLNIDNNGATLNYVSARVTNSVMPAHPNSVYCLPRTWDVLVDGVLDAVFSFFWTADQETTNFTSVRQNDHIQSYCCHDGSNWVTISTPTGATGSGTLSDPYRADFGGIAIVSDFCLGDEDNPLPVTLSSFSAVMEDDIPTLHWITQSESENLGWNVYRGILAEDWDFQLNTELIAGSGTTSIPTEYDFQDRFPVEEGRIYYYWLESVSYSSEYEIFGPVSLLIETEEEPPIGNELPEITALETNYPNPFNPETTIAFDIKNGEKGTLTIFNLRGQKILEKSFTAGSYEYVWNASTQTSGIYFYRLQTPSYYETKKMSLIK